MDHEDLKKRSAGFARAVWRFTQPLFRSPETGDVAKQLRRAANGMASNYRAAGVSRSHKEFTARIGTVLEESDESVHWLEHLQAVGHPVPRDLRLEAAELRNIFAQSATTAREKERANRRRGR